MSSSSLRPSFRDRAKHAARRQAARLVGGERELPSYFIVGTKRGGTTSLSAYIHQHPDVMRPFVEKGCRYFDVNYGRGWDWFVQNMPSAREADRAERDSGVRPIVGESSPYYAFHPESPGRIAADFPDARLIFLVRDPILRAWSHYNFERSLGFEPLDIHDALDAEPQRLSDSDPEARSHSHRHHSYLARGLYAEQIERMHESFAPDQLLVVRSEALFNAPDATMSEVHGHLRLVPHAGDYRTISKANSYDGIPESVQDRLTDYYSEPNLRLRVLLGRDLEWL